ncbi:hypothetical protein KP509_34G023400 [Ceratopteris richardii]|uniref:Uncharacterized protein n=1 Tax=Ceratopteris richardii TaxID=49495 RepID=A0A8T2QJR6_CERRI|nr:hypothetical protein KP509_34G023400 [Ceratopteris richardii]
MGNEKVLLEMLKIELDNSKIPMEIEGKLNTKNEFEGDGIVEKERRIQLKMQIQVSAMILELFGVKDVSTENLIVLQQEQMVVEVGRHTNFVCNMFNMLKSGEIPSCSPNCLPQLVVEDMIILVVHLSPCHHIYHYICFSTICTKIKYCVGDCGSEIHVRFSKAFSTKNIFHLS